MNREETRRAIEHYPWNVLKVSIPIDADKALLTLMYESCARCIQICSDLQDDWGWKTPPSQERKAVAAREIVKARKRLKQVEWRLNVMGL